MRHRFIPLAAAAFALCAVLSPAPAAAYERQWHAGLGLGYGLLTDDPVSHGFGGGLHLTYGLTDAFNAMIEIDVTGHTALRQEMSRKAGGRWTVPQIWIGDAHVGGCDDLYALDRIGRLDPMLAH